MSDWDPAEVSRELGLDESFDSWLKHLDGLGDISERAPLDQGDAAALLQWLGVAAGDAAEIVALLPALCQHRALQQLVGRCHFDLTRNLGDESAPPFQTLRFPAHLSAISGLFWLYVFLEGAQAVRRWHGTRGIPDDISWATLSPFGEQIRRYKAENGRWGVEMPFFSTLAFRGVLFQIGRLSYIPYRLCTGPGGPLFWYDTAAAEARGPGFRPGEPALSIHIPAEAPLDAAECGVSMRRAGEIFANHFVPDAPQIATCTSWLLDPQLAEYLPASSNIVRFQRRFQIVPGVRVDNESIVSALYGRSEAAAAEPVRETALQRAVTRHLEAGKDWHLRTGWLDLRRAAGAE